MDKYIGERLLGVIYPWDGIRGDDSMILEFESGLVRILARDYSEPGHGGNPTIEWEEA